MKGNTFVIVAAILGLAAIGYGIFAGSGPEVTVQHASGIMPSPLDQPQAVEVTGNASSSSITAEVTDAHPVGFPRGKDQATWQQAGRPIEKTTEDTEKGHSKESRK